MCLGVSNDLPALSIDNACAAYDIDSRVKSTLLMHIFIHALSINEWLFYYV